MWTSKIALRENKEDKKHDQESKINTENFKAFLKYRFNGGSTYLGDHLQNVPRNPTYMSKTISKWYYFNHRRDDSKKYRQRLQRFWSIFFSIYAENVRDVGNHELALTIKFVSKENQIKEEFLAVIVNRC